MAGVGSFTGSSRCNLLGGRLRLRDLGRLDGSLLSFLFDLRGLRGLLLVWAGWEHAEMVDADRAAARRGAYAQRYGDLRAEREPASSGDRLVGAARRSTRPVIDLALGRAGEAADVVDHGNDPGGVLLCGGRRDRQRGGDIAAERGALLAEGEQAVGTAGEVSACLLERQAPSLP
ncbi:MAG: hypothetical protein M3340_00320, partial [Actinomycetota bacterium]|nr:hypothetical protein [Actinomycetota bacterium]